MSERTPEDRTRELTKRQLARQVQTRPEPATSVARLLGGAFFVLLAFALAIAQTFGSLTFAAIVPAMAVGAALIIRS